MTDLKHYIRVYDDALPDTFCQQALDWFEQHPDDQQVNGGSFRAGLSESSWVEMDLSDCHAFGFSNIIKNCLKHYKSTYERDCGIEPALPDPLDLAPLIIKRYQPGGDGFQPHIDSLGPVASRYMVFLWYLNTVDRGGETDFLDLGVKVAPKPGRLVIFPPYWMYRHAGLQPVSGPKYILSTYCLW